MTTYSAIKGYGHYLPKRVLDNHYFEKMVDTNDEWIRSRTGIVTRHFTSEGETSSTMAVEAAKVAIKNADISVEDIDLILVGTVTGDTRYPSTAALVHKALKISKPVPSMDLQAACAGFVYALSMADSFIKAGVYTNILVVGVENLSKFTDMEDRNTCVLFGDGAGAVVVSASDEPGILGFHLAADGNYSHLIEFPADGSKTPTSEDTIKQRLHYTTMEGQETYKQAVKDMTSAAQTVLGKLDMTVDDVTWLVPHQANIRIIKSVATRLKIAIEKVYINVDRIGNTSAASVPIALAELDEQKKIKKGDIVVLSALGSGLTWGALVYKQL